MLALAARQHVRPLVRRRLISRDLRERVPPDVLEALSRSHEAIAYINLAMHAELARLLKALAAHDIPAILLKGAYVAAAVYGDIALREMGDLDVMVRREHIERATAIALSLGFAPERPFAVAVDVAVSQHVTRLYKPPHARLELHWNVTDPDERYSIEPADLWTRSVPERIVNADARTLSLEDLLLHLCLHTAYRHRFEFGLRSLCDVAHLLQHRGATVNWDVVQRRADACRWLPGTRLALRLSRDLLGAPIPDAAIEALQIDGVSPEIHDDARVQLLAGYAGRGTPVRHVSELTDHEGAWPRWRHVGHHVFPARHVLRHRYPWAPASPWLSWLVYVWRPLDLLKHARTVYRVWRRDPALSGLEERRRRLRVYLAEMP